MIVDTLLALYAIGVLVGAVIALRLMFGGGDGSATELLGMAILCVAFWPITILYCWASVYFGPGGKSA